MQNSKACNISHHIFQWCSFPYIMIIFTTHNITLKPKLLNKQPPLCPMCHDSSQPFPIKRDTWRWASLVCWAMPWVGSDPGRFRRHCPNVKKTCWHPRFCAPCAPRVVPRVLPRVVPCVVARVVPVCSFPHIHGMGTTSKTVHSNRCFALSMATVPPHRQFATTG